MMVSDGICSFDCVCFCFDSRESCVNFEFPTDGFKDTQYVDIWLRAKLKAYSIYTPSAKIT